MSAGSDVFTGSVPWRMAGNKSKVSIIILYYIFLIFQWLEYSVVQLYQNE